MARRLRLTLAYDGHRLPRLAASSPARPPSRGCSMERSARVLGAPVDVTGASRTDAGVHALRPGRQPGDRHPPCRRRALGPRAQRAAAAGGARGRRAARRPPASTPAAARRGKRYALPDRPRRRRPIPSCGATPGTRRPACDASRDGATALRAAARQARLLRLLRGARAAAARRSAPSRSARVVARRERLAVLPLGRQLPAPHGAEHRGQPGRGGPRRAARRRGSARSWTAATAGGPGRRRRPRGWSWCGCSMPRTA